MVYNILTMQKRDCNYRGLGTFLFYVEMGKKKAPKGVFWSGFTVFYALKMAIKIKSPKLSGTFLIIKKPYFIRLNKDCNTSLFCKKQKVPESFGDFFSLIIKTCLYLFFYGYWGVCLPLKV